MLSTTRFLIMPRMARSPPSVPISSGGLAPRRWRPSALAASAAAFLPPLCSIRCFRRLFFAAVLLYPVFQAIVYRWWLSGLRFGAIAVTSQLRIGQVYLIYLRYIGLVWLFMIGASIGVGVLVSAVFALLNAVHLAGNQVPGRDVIGAGI